MSEVFISYSRKDTVFVRRLHDALRSSGRDTWVDWEDIPVTAQWWSEVCSGIEGANTFIFIMSPDSLDSKICADELNHALTHRKRLIPIVHRDAGSKPIPEALSSHNWLFFREGDAFETAYAALLKALDTDLEHVRTHTRLLVRAREWDARSRDDSLLLRGGDLQAAEGWLGISTSKDPRPTDLHTQYITASRAAAVRRQRATLAAVSTALVISLVLAVIAFAQSVSATNNAVAAQTNESRAIDAQLTAVREADERATQQIRAQNSELTAVAAQETAVREADQRATEQRRAERGESTAIAAIATIERFLPRISIIDNRIRLRTGPGTEYPVIGFVNKGESFPVFGQFNGTLDGEVSIWYLIELPNDSRAWITSAFANQEDQLIIDIPILTTVTALPTPTMTPTPRATSTLSASLTPSPTMTPT